MIEGDQETSFDADRIRAAGARAVQVNTGAGCHLDAAMVHRALHDLDPPEDSLLFIENVGNLVCPALFDLGEHAKVVVISVTEGDDKPLKYPHMFCGRRPGRGQQDRPAALRRLRRRPRWPRRPARCNPDVEVLPLSVRTGEQLRRLVRLARSDPRRREERAVEQPSVREVSERIDALLDDLARARPRP